MNREGSRFQLFCHPTLQEIEIYDIEMYILKCTILRIYPIILALLLSVEYN